MAAYRFAVGTHDPEGIVAGDDADALRQAVEILLARYADDLAANPQDVATLLGPGGLITRASERIDEFVTRVTAANPSGAPGEVQPGDSNTPDCNGD